MGYEELINKYRSGTLNEAELENLRCWLHEADPEEVIGILEINGNQWTEDVPDDSLERLRTMVYSRIREMDSDSTANVGRVSGFWKKYAIAATLLLPLLFVGVLYGVINRNADVKYTTISTTGNNRTKIALPDGSVAIIKGESTLEFPVEFSGEERKVTLNGQAYFEVAKDTKHPFKIESPYITVNVLGTRFSMIGRRTLEYSEIILDNGKVEVTSLSSNSSTVLKPGEMLTVNNSSGEMDVRPAPQSVLVDWINDEILYRRVRPDTLIRSIESNYGIRLSPSVRKRMTSRFSGTLPTNDLATTMEVLGSVYDFDMPYVYEDDAVSKRFIAAPR